MALNKCCIIIIIIIIMDNERQPNTVGMGNG